MKRTLEVHKPGPEGVETTVTKTANVKTWLERNKGLPEHTRVTVRMPSGGTLQYRLARVRHKPLWLLDRQTFV